MNTLDVVLDQLDLATQGASPAELARSAHVDPEWDPLVSGEAAAIAAGNAESATFSSGAQPSESIAVGSAAAGLAADGYGLVMRLVGRPDHTTDHLPYAEFADTLEALEWTGILPAGVLDTANWVAATRSPFRVTVAATHNLLVEAFITGVAAAVVELDLSEQMSD